MIILKISYINIEVSAEKDHKTLAFTGADLHYASL